MKKCIIIIVILLISLLCFDNIVKATETKSDFEYYNVSYDFLNDNEYYVTYKFKPNEEKFATHSNYYFSDENVYLDTIEHNVNDYHLVNTVIENYADMRFSLNESKEYYLKYKAFLNGKGTNINGICLKSISKNKMKKNPCDDSDAVSVYSFELNIYHPENINFNKDKINGISNLILMDEGESFKFLAGEEYEKNNYYDVTIYKNLILKSDVDHEKKIIQTLKIGLPSIIFIVFAIVIIIKKYKMKIIK